MKNKQFVILIIPNNTNMYKSIGNLTSHEIYENFVNLQVNLELKYNRTILTRKHEEVSWEQVFLFHHLYEILQSG